MKDYDVLILGVNGMLGSTMMQFFKQQNKFTTCGTIRNEILSDKIRCFEQDIFQNVIAEDPTLLENLIISKKPKFIINCIGIIKQLDVSNDASLSININSIFPHRLAFLCKKHGVRLIHISTDCVFNGAKGMYVENDLPDAEDLYGKTKFLGEVTYDHCVTLRTSIIGHETSSSHSLLEWFLKQDGEVNGYQKAIFSGFPTFELSKIIHDIVLCEPSLSGLYHVSSEPINKYDLLKLFSEIYLKEIKINVDQGLIINRSLDSTKFRNITGFEPSSWKSMIKKMREFG